MESSMLKQIKSEKINGTVDISIGGIAIRIQPADQKEKLSLTVNDSESCPQHSCTYCYAKSEASDHERYVSLEGGRKLCPGCASTAVFDESQLLEVIKLVDRYFAEEFNLVVERDFPILLVLDPDYREIRKRDIRNHPASEEECSRSYGFTFSGDELTVMAVKCHKREGQNILATKEARELKTKKLKPESNTSFLAQFGNALGFRSPGGCKPAATKAIILKWGTPRVCLGLYLAHLMLASWLNDHGLCISGGNTGWISAGLCGVVRKCWLDWVIDVHEQGHEKKLVKKQKEAVVYGKGFRDAMARVDKYGLKQTLLHVAHHKELPKFPRHCIRCAHSQLICLHCCWNNVNVLLLLLALLSLFIAIMV